MVYDIWTAADSPFLHVLTLIYCNGVPHCPWCRFHRLDTEILFLSRFVLLFHWLCSCKVYLFVGRCKMLRHNVSVKMMWMQMWLLRHLHDNIFYFVSLSQFYFRLDFVRLPPFGYFCSFFMLLYVRGHLQGGSSFSSSVAASAARRVRQLPQLPPKSSTVEQGTY